MEDLNTFIQEAEGDDSVQVYDVTAASPCDMRVNGVKVDLFEPIDRSLFEELKSKANVSGFGDGTALRFDKTVRSSHEIRGEDIHLNFDLCSLVRRHANVDQFFSMGSTTFERNTNLVVEKLLLYAEDDGFTWHVDVADAEAVTATAVVILPTTTPCEGGQLELKLDKGRHMLPFYGLNHLKPWLCYFPIQVPHRVQVVEKGFRVALILKDYMNRAKLITNPIIKCDFSYEKLFQLAKRLNFSDKQFVWTTEERIVNVLLRAFVNSRVFVGVTFKTPSVGVSVYDPSNFENYYIDHVDQKIAECTPFCYITDVVKTPNFKNTHRACGLMFGDKPTALCKAEKRHFKGYVIYKCE